jgi:ethanolamine utilization protein EutP (predicted NTPase)
MVAQMVKQNVTLLQKCLKSSNKAIFYAAIESLNNASNMFGPALNKHLPHILPLVKAKQDLASDERIATLVKTLKSNGGDDADKILSMNIYKLK